MFFFDLLRLVPSADSEASKPPSKPSLVPTIRSIISLTNLKSSSKDVVKQLYDMDCEEAFSALIHIYKTESYPRSLREHAIDAVFEQCRGRYNVVINNIRSMLLEYIMKVFVRFSVSSMPVSLLFFILTHVDTGPMHQLGVAPFQHRSNSQSSL